MAGARARTTDRSVKIGPLVRTVRVSRSPYGNTPRWERLRADSCGLSCGPLRVVNTLGAADSGTSCDGTPEGDQIMTAEVNTAGASPGGNDAAVTDLVGRARNGDKRAWDALVGRYAPLIWSICRRYELRGADAEDVGQSVWLHLVDQLDRVRDPAALPGWLATTARRECVRVLRAAEGPYGAGPAPDAENTPDEKAADGGRGTARGRATRGAACGTRGLAPMLPAADRPADRGPAVAICRDRRQAGHPGRQHRAEPPPLPGQTAA